MDSLQKQLINWQNRLNFYKEEESQLVDLDQKYSAKEKIEDVELKIKNLKDQIYLESCNEDEGKTDDNLLKSSTDIKTLHQALDLFVQESDKIDYKSSQKEVEELEKIKNDILDKLLGDYREKIDSIPLLKDKVIINLFEQILAAEKLKTPIISDIYNIRKDFINHKSHHRGIIVSALTLSVLSWKSFDSKKVDCLIDFLTDFEEDVWQRALTGIILAVVIHQNRLLRYPDLITRLRELQELEKIQIGIFLIDTILRNQLFLHVIFPENLKEEDFLKESPYNWFFPFYKENPVLKNALDNTEQDIEEEDFRNFIYSIPLVGAFKYAICNSLKDNKINFIISKEEELNQTEEEFQNEISKMRLLSLAHSLNPYYNLIAEIFLYYKYFPKERVQKLFNSKITLAETKLKNIILSKTQSLKLSADLHYEKKEYNNSIIKLKELLNIEPNQLSALILIAKCHESKKEFSEALSYYLQIDNFRKDDVKNIFKIGYCLNKTEHYKKSIEYLSRANLLMPTNENILNLIGNNYFELKDYKKSIEFNKQALEINDTHERALEEISIGYSCLEKPELAIKYSMKLHDLFPKNPKYMMGLAVDYAELGNFEEALSLGKKVYDDHSSKAYFAFTYSRILFVSGVIKESKNILTKVLRLKDNASYLAITYGNLGHVFLFEKNITKSLEYYQKCVLLFDDISDFEKKFNVDLKYALKHEISQKEYEKIRQELVTYWHGNK